MIAELKKELLKDPESIRELLEEFGFEHINIRGNYMRFARSVDGGQNISLCLDDEYLNVMDFVHGKKKDIISYIISEKNTDFKTVLNAIKRILNLSNDWTPIKKRSIFGGIYEKIIHRESVPQKVYDEEILKDYLLLPNERFKHDKIDLNTQVRWNIGYDINTDRITIPIRNEMGQIVGIKGRANYEIEEWEPKYMYLDILGHGNTCRMSNNLYGYSENYSNMYGKTVLVFESEKSVLQCASYGYNNAVAIGSNSLSEQQAKLLLQLNPENVIFMLDSDLPLENTKKNIDVLRSVCAMRSLHISYFDWTECLDLGEKCSPSDEGKEVFEDILKNYIKDESCLEGDDL